MEPRAYLSELFVSVQGEGSRAGERHLFVRFAGCNLRCSYCDTPESLVRVPECVIDWPDGRRERAANPVCAARLAEWIDEFCSSDPAISMIALTGGEPLVQRRFLETFLAEQRLPRPFLLETNALICDRVESIAARAGIISADIKLPSAEGVPHWEEHERFFALCRAKRLDAKIVVGEETPESEVCQAARLVARWAPDAVVFLQPMTDPASGRWRITQARLWRLAALASRHAPVRLRPQLHRLAGMR
ncbi:MAG: 7-carboxy-7-deazaguanine synthase QueE [Deltaproteobacteria bacterium]|nr:MAG: 7-carboxy-7-deazaguanine synthase QueE [Deltaproteobacteria bacterium]